MISYNPKIPSYPILEKKELFIFSKNKEKSCLLIFNKKIDQKEEDFITKMLGAAHIKYGIDTVSYLLNDQCFFLAKQLKSSDYSQIFLFGVELPQLGLNFSTKLSYYKLNNKNLFITSDVSTLSGDPRLKKQLWNDMQKNILNNK